MIYDATLKNYLFKMKTISEITIILHYLRTTQENNKEIVLMGTVFFSFAPV